MPGGMALVLRGLWRPGGIGARPTPDPPIFRVFLVLRFEEKFKELSTRLQDLPSTAA